jgi:UDP-N-acetylmuramyl pentapeptide phosphotransferase/UDP-N-acetylglucosamine-1-phosphate transferase
VWLAILAILMSFTAIIVMCMYFARNGPDAWRKVGQSSLIIIMLLLYLFTRPIEHVLEGIAEISRDQWRALKHFFTALWESIIALIAPSFVIAMLSLTSDPLIRRRLTIYAYVYALIYACLIVAQIVFYIPWFLLHRGEPGVGTSAYLWKWIAYHAGLPEVFWRNSDD